MMNLLTFFTNSFDIKLSFESNFQKANLALASPRLGAIDSTEMVYSGDDHKSREAGLPVAFCMSALRGLA